MLENGNHFLGSRLRGNDARGISKTLKRFKCVCHGSRIEHILQTLSLSTIRIPASTSIDRHIAAGSQGYNSLILCANVKIEEINETLEFSLKYPILHAVDTLSLPSFFTKAFFENIYEMVITQGASLPQVLAYIEKEIDDAVEVLSSPYPFLTEAHLKKMREMITEGYSIDQIEEHVAMLAKTYKWDHSWVGYVNPRSYYRERYEWKKS